MPATSTVKEVHGFTDPLTKGKMESLNPDLFRTDMPRMYPIHRHINIFSVARRDFPMNHVYYKGTLKGCKNGERFVKCYAVPDPPQQIAIDVESGRKRVEVEPRDEAGWRVAIDILNPNNPSTNPYYQLSAGQAAYFGTGQNVDLVKYGLFPSLNDEPTEAELLRAEKVRDDSYHALVDEAFAEQQGNPQGFRTWLRQHPDINIAMDALGYKADWHSKVEAKQACPNCGETVKAGIAFHIVPGVGACVIDWKRAVSAGVKSRADVPEDQIWWETEQKRGPGRPPKEMA